ncbi:hypothetical protein HW132_30090 [Brasilonema sp. CT11]|nr:hypothetical protein [Brasilonema sp. CT11]
MEDGDLPLCRTRSYRLNSHAPNKIPDFCQKLGILVLGDRLAPAFQHRPCSS